MAGITGANTSTDGLVFYYDTGNLTRSYIGEPTTNLLPNAPVNALPTFGNGWATYNTNQYNGAQYFSIGTIASVSSNIVTTTTNHPIRSFDVLRPQTTGGGLSAGVDYVVKKISNTQFSLHAYNSSQDGSQGYINPSTGGFKVHDSYWLDQRVSINATDFPTMWWGAPHLPNSAIVKEIIVDGFDVNPSRKTDCIRLHWFRTDTTDGMAYGVDTPLTIGEPTTVSFWARAASQSAVGQYISFSNYNYTGPAGYTNFGMTATWGALGEWVRNSYTFTPTHNAIISYWFPSLAGMKVDIANIQVEHKSHRTAFTTGTRSATEGLLDMTGNSIINLNNVSFDSDSKIVFDGSDDTIYMSDAAHLNPYTSDFTVEHVFYCTNAGVGEGILHNKEDLYEVAVQSGYLRYAWRPHWNWDGGTSFPVSSNTWYYVAVTYDHSTQRMYKNGVQVYSRSQTGDIGSNSNVLSIGARGVNSSGGSGYNIFPGEIPITKIYNRALTADEIQQNFLAYKTRFGI